MIDTTTDEAAVRTTRAVDILLRRSDWPTPRQPERLAGENNGTEFVLGIW